MTNANDNAVLSLTNATHSLTLRLLADGSYVLSLFALGADGEPDFDRGEVFVRDIPRVIPGHTNASSVESRARCAFDDYAALLRCKADRFDSECSAVYQWASSVSGCPTHHHKSGAAIPGGTAALQREMGTLARAIRDLKLATLIRRNPELEARRVRALEHGESVLLNGAKRLA